MQGLRALAALSVAFLHIANNGLTLDPNAQFLSLLRYAMPWDAGVDIFFVISGFIIAYTSAPFFAAPQGRSKFLARRLARIVPLYWLTTTLFLLSLAVAPDAINGAIGGAGYILASYFFIPCTRPDGAVQPALGLGWTLNYEMFFYLLFTPFLFLSKNFAIIAASACLGLFVLLGCAGVLHGVVLTTWSNPILLEFCAGMLLALLPGRVSLPSAARLVLVAGALILLRLQPAGWSHLIYAGIPAICLVAAATLGRSPEPTMLHKSWLVRLGDASYALYLTHPFVMRIFDLLSRHLHVLREPMLYVPLSLTVAQIVALIVHHVFERRATFFIRFRLEALALARP